MSILLREINDINQLVLAPKSIGYLENVYFNLSEIIVL